VVVSGRSREGVSQAVSELSAEFGADRIAGKAAEMSDFEQVKSLWSTAVERFGGVDIWINNAGVGQPWSHVSDLPPQELRRVVESNLLGTLNGCRVALAGMRSAGSGAIFTMEGFGSDGRLSRRMVVYGATKRAVRYLTRGLVLEERGGPVRIGSISPGMVATDLLTGPVRDDPGEFARAKRVFNILADRVETVAPYLASRILHARKHGARIAWLTTGKVLLRFLAAPFSRRELFS
jgi:NAD(P)-dependent dehydrogenase (short-subunit alcohol dehydrogenase family)